MTGALPPLLISHHAGGHAERPRFSRSQHHSLTLWRIRAAVCRLDKGKQLPVALNGDAPETIVELPGGETRYIAPALRRQHKEFGSVHVARQILGTQQFLPERLPNSAGVGKFWRNTASGMQS